MKVLKMDVKQNYHSLDRISDGMEMAFSGFVSANINKTIKDSLFQSIKLNIKQISTKTLDFFDIQYKVNEDEKISIMRKDLLLLFCAVDIEKITGNRNLAKQIINNLQNLYFSTKGNTRRLDILSFHIVNVLFYQRGAYLYVYDGNISRFANIDQHLISLSMDKPLYGYIEVDLPKILYRIFKDSEAPSMEDNLFTLTDKEVGILSEVRLQKYDVETIKIKFDANSIPKEMFIEGKEFDLDRYTILDEMVKHGVVGHKKYKEKKQYIKISEIVNLEKDNK